MTTTDIARRREKLVQRLDDGYARIEQAVADGANVAAWETFWIELLREYESVCEEIDVVSRVNARRERLRAATPPELPVRTIAQVKELMNRIADDEGLPEPFGENGTARPRSWQR